MGFFVPEGFDMQPPFDIAADLDTPVSAFLKLRGLEPRYLLESVEGGTRLARYSFIGFGAATELVISAGELRLNGVATALPSSANGYLDAFREVLNGLPQLAPATPELPFTGGLVGYAGYDVVRRFERLDAAAPRSASEPEAAYVATEALLVFDHLTRRAALLSSGSDADRRALGREVRARLRGALPATVRGGYDARPAQSLSEARYIAGVGRVKEAIAAGDVYQLVLSVLFDGRADLDAFEVYRALRLLNPSPYMFFCDIGGLKVAGSSPEALVRLNGRTARLRPIAGTRPRGRDRREDAANAAELAADPKEVAEHVMLVDLARNDLGRVAETGSVQVDPYMSIERYSHVMHIVSGVRGTMAPGCDAFDLFRAAFPAGTLVGAPKIRAMQLIDELEPVNRGLYAGTVGYFAQSGDMDQAITIRTLVFDDNGYRFQAGAGIVADSDPALEYQEVLHKSAVLRRALAMAAEGI